MTYQSQTVVTAQPSESNSLAEPEKPPQRLTTSGCGHFFNFRQGFQSLRVRQAEQLQTVTIVLPVPIFHRLKRVCSVSWPCRQHRPGVPCPAFRHLSSRHPRWCAYVYNITCPRRFVKRLLAEFEILATIADSFDKPSLPMYVCRVCLASNPPSP